MFYWVVFAHVLYMCPVGMTRAVTLVAHAVEVLGADM